MDVAKSLSYNYAFKGLPETTLLALAGECKLREFEGGDNIVRQFDKSESVFVILEGEALSRTFEGEVVARFGPGSLVGELGLIDGEPRSTNVVSVGKSKAAEIPAAFIRKLMDENPRIGYAISWSMAKVLCRRLRTMNARETHP